MNAPARLSALLLLLAATACGPRPSSDFPLQITVSPADTAPGRHESIVLTGVTGFHPGSPVTASLGEGIVATATVESRTRVVLTLDADANAALGMRDVLLVQDGHAIGLAGAFTVKPPFEVLGEGVKAGAWTEIHLRGLRTRWTPDSHVLTDPSLRVTHIQVDAPDELIARVQVDLFATAASASMSVDGEQATSAATILPAPVVDLAAQAEVAGSFEGSPSEFRVWRADLASGEVARFAAPRGDATFNPQWEIYDPGVSGFEPEKILRADAASVETSFAGRSFWIVLRSPAPVFEGSLSWAFSFRRMTAAKLAATLPEKQPVTDAGQIDGWRVERIAPWCLVDVRVDASGWTNPITPVAVAGRKNSWESGAIAGAPGETIVVRTLVSSSADVLSYVVRDAAGSASAGYGIRAAASPIRGKLFTHPGVSRAFDAGMPLRDAIQVHNVASPVAVHLAVDIAHSQRGSLRLTLASPAGVTVDVVVPDEFDSREDLITAFPDLDVPRQSLMSALGTGTPEGEWTLSVATQAAGKSGILRGWALSFELAPSSAGLPGAGAPGAAAPAPTSCWLP